MVLIDSTAPASAPTSPPQHASRRHLQPDGPPLSARVRAPPSSVSCGSSSASTSRRCRPNSEAAMRANIATSLHLRSTIDEYLHAGASAKEAAALTTFNDKPLFVLTAGVGSSPGWMPKQDKLAALSTNSAHHVVEGAAHVDLLIDERAAAATSRAILDVVASVRTGEPLPASSTTRADRPCPANWPSRPQLANANVQRTRRARASKPVERPNERPPPIEAQQQPQPSHTATPTGTSSLMSPTATPPPRRTRHEHPGRHRRLGAGHPRMAQRLRTTRAAAPPGGGPSAKPRRQNSTRTAPAPGPPRARGAGAPRPSAHGARSTGRRGSGTSVAARAALPQPADVPVRVGVGHRAPTPTSMWSSSTQRRCFTTPAS